MSRHTVIKKRWDDHLVDILANTISVLFALVCVLPFLLVLVYSITPYHLYLQNHFDLFPDEVTLDAYRMVIRYKYMWTGYRNTIFISLTGTILSMLLLTLSAYPLTHHGLPGNKIYMKLWIVTMFFSGGMIPDYMLIRSLGLLNSLWAIILPGLLGCYNLILMRNYMESLPHSLEEAATIDGANEFQLLFRVVLPLCKPILATLGLFTIVGYWNSYFSSILYITKREKWPLQLVIRQLLFEATDEIQTGTASEEYVAAPFVLRMASIVVSIVPIMLVYPFLQRYFTTGLVLGGVKE